MARDPPPGYTSPPFPSLNTKTLIDYTPQKRYTLFYIFDVWKFTLLWTLIVYAVFHLAAVVIAAFMHRWKKLSWRYVWMMFILYLVIAGVEAAIAGSLVGVMSGYYEMNTWIPFTWAFINVLILIVSSFSIQGGL